VQGAVLSDRVLFFLSKISECHLHSSSLSRPIKLTGHLSQDEKELLYRRAKLSRKLKYIEKVLGVEFTLPDKITWNDALYKVEVVFRGITEGEFILWDKEWTMELPPNVDLTKPPFTGPGPFSRYFPNKMMQFFGQRFSVGPVKVLLRNAELANPRVLDQIREGKGQHVEVWFKVLDHQIHFRFEDFAKQPREHLGQRLEEFKQELAREEPQELVDLVSEPLQSDAFLDAEPSPPLVDDVPEPLRSELKALEQLTDEELWNLTESHLAPARQRTLTRLLRKNQAGTLTKKERQQLNEVLEEGEDLTVKKAHAWLLLKWRGHRIPTLEELREKARRSRR
jgi:hypothetical protein